MNRITFLFVFLLFGELGLAQSNCGCDGIDMTWLQEVKDNITEEILNPPITPCGSSNGSIRQCRYLGQTVFVYVPTILPCDVGTQVRDCNGDFVFSFGGFCNGPCPGDDQVQFLEDCEEIYSVPDNLICDNSCVGTNAVLLEFACLSTEASDDQVCVPITTMNFMNMVSFQGGILWDPSILTYTGLNEIALTGITINTIDAQNGSVRFLWLIPFNATPVDLMDNSILFEICFDIIGNSGTMSSIDLVDMQNFSVELANGNNEVEPHCAESGKVSVGTSDITLESLELEVNFCNFTEVPTLGQWALISLSILFLIFGITAIRENHASILNSN